MPQTQSVPAGETMDTAHIFKMCTCANPYPHGRIYQVTDGEEREVLHVNIPSIDGGQHFIEQVLDVSHDVADRLVAEMRNAGLPQFVPGDVDYVEDRLMDLLHTTVEIEMIEITIIEESVDPINRLLATIFRT